MLENCFFTTLALRLFFPVYRHWSSQLNLLINLWCKCPSGDCHDATKKWSVTDAENGVARTIAEIKECARLKKPRAQKRKDLAASTNHLSINWNIKSNSWYPSPLSKNHRCPYHLTNHRAEKAGCFEQNAFQVHTNQLYWSWSLWAVPNQRMQN